jgi:hypothetical protein
MSARTPVWTARQRFAFRFGVIYFALYALLNGNVATLPLVLIARRGQVPDWYAGPTNALWASIGHAIGLRGAIRPFDNGDGVGDHVQLGVFVIVALIGAVAWSRLDAKRVAYPRGWQLLCRAVRYVLAMTVFAYAIFKVFPVQFSVPAPSRLLQTYGASSRMSLLWTAMGASPGYQMFCGWVELAGCASLMTRRTTALGASILLAALTNVFVMDLCYAVPAKLCVLHLLAMALFLLVPHATRLRDAFLREAASATRRQLAAKVAFIALVLGVEGIPVGRYYFEERDGAPLPPFYGAYEIVDMSGPSDWRQLAVDRQSVSAFTGNGTRIRFARSAVSLARTDQSDLAIEGIHEGAPFKARARLVDASKQFLVNQPTRWFIDHPDLR